MTPRPVWLSEPAAGLKLPYQAQVDDHTLLLRDGSLMQTLRLQGLPFETADTEELNYRKQLRDATLRALASSRFALYHHVVRRAVAPPDAAEFPDSFSQRVETAWTGRLRAKQMFRNDIYLTIVRRPARARGAWTDMLLGKARTGAQDALVEERRAISAARETLAAGFSRYNPTPLGVRPHRGAIASDLLQFLSMLFNGQDRPVCLPHGDLGGHIPSRRLLLGQEDFELSPALGQERSFGAIVSVKDYPGASTPAMLDDLLRLPLEMVLTQSFAFVDRGAALGRTNLALRRMRAADDEAVSLRGELALACDDLAAGRTAFGEHHLTLTLRGNTLKGLDDGVAETQSALADLGIVAVREDLGLEPAFWAQFPGNAPYITRRALISTRNFAAFASGHNFAQGRSQDLHWGRPVTTLETTAAGPYFFNFHNGDLGNFTVIGPSGAGKTVVLNFLLAQALRFRPRIAYFDKDRGSELFLRAIGGLYHVLRPGEPAGLNPLQLPDTPANRRFLVEWISTLVSQRGGQAAPEDLVRIEEAVAANFAAPAEMRRLEVFADLTRGGQRPHAGDLHDRLRPWLGAGEHAWLFDNAEDRIAPSARICGFDMTRLLDDPTLRTPAMMYLFHRVEQSLDGTPAIIVVDEGWKALDDSIFRRRIRDWEKTIRKRNGLVGFVTQSAEDALKSEIAADIVEQAGTQIFMANPKAQARDYVGGFGLTAHELDLIRALPASEHCFLVKQGNESAIVRLNLDGEREILTILSGRERTVRLLDDIRGRAGDAPSDWMLELLAIA